MAIVQPGLRRKQEVRYGATSQTLTLIPDVDGATVDPATGATVSIFRPHADISTSSQAEVLNAAASEDSNNFLTYALNASTTATYYLGEDWLAVWTYTASSVVRVQRQLFDVVRVPLNHFPPCNINDLKSAYLEVDTALSQAGVTDGHQRFILPAWNELLTLLEARGGWRPSLITDPVVFAPTLRELALRHMCEGLSRKPGDVWAERAKRHDERWPMLWENTAVRYNPGDSSYTDKQRGRTQPAMLVGNDLRR